MARINVSKDERAILRGINSGDITLQTGIDDLFVAIDSDGNEDSVATEMVKNLFDNGLISIKKKPKRSVIFELTEAGEAEANRYSRNKPAPVEIDDDDDEEEEIKPVKRGRGRPPKNSVPVITHDDDDDDEEEEIAAPAPRRRGRPRKVVEEEIPAPVKRGPGRPRKSETISAPTTAKKRRVVEEEEMDEPVVPSVVRRRGRPVTRR